MHPPVARRMGAALAGALLVASVPTVAPAVASPVASSAASSVSRADAPVGWSVPSRQRLAKVKPGTVLKKRTVSYHVQGIALPLTVVQLQFRSTDQLGRPSVGVTSVVKPPLVGNGQVVSYQSFYDSLNPADQPSTLIAGDLSLGQTRIGGGIVTIESALIAPLLLQGFTVVVPDTQGPTADFAAGREYGAITLDSLRAAKRERSLTGVAPKAKIGLIGYSGGAIATGWASALQPAYAPGLTKNLIGAAEGGVLVDPAHNLHYIDGSQIWAGVAPMALIGIARAFEIDLTPYLNARGKKLLADMADDSIAEVLGAYPGLTFADLTKKKYADPNSIPEYVTAANLLNMGLAPSPTLPMFIGQGANGVLEGTTPSDEFGAGDGVMVAGDVRSLARQYCADGTTVQYRQYDALSHFTTVALWLPEAIGWLEARFAGLDAPSNCGSIAKGNSLAPEKVTR